MVRTTKTVSSATAVKVSGMSNADADIFCCKSWFSWRFFFFQAEDGIRDLYVTGVQTCALPISFRSRSRESPACIIAPNAKGSRDLGLRDRRRGHRRLRARQPPLGGSRGERASAGRDRKSVV